MSIVGVVLCVLYLYEPALRLLDWYTNICWTGIRVCLQVFIAGEVSDGYSVRNSTLMYVYRCRGHARS